MFFEDENGEDAFFTAWSLINLWIGVLACAVAFCSLASDFANLCKLYSDKINISLFVAAISCVLKEIILLMILSVKESQIKEKIKREMEGDTVCQE